jgi:non-heme chloroperoxidase
MHRRELLTTFATAGAAATATMTSGERTLAASDSGAARRPHPPYIESHDGTRLYWREWGSGAPVMFVHSWCMQSDMWGYQFATLGERGMQCIAYDRRGHGRSDQPATGYDYDTLADDMASVIEALDLHDLTLVGHSMGAAEIVRYLTRHGSARVRRIVLLSPVLPFLTQTADNPFGAPADMFDALRATWRADFPKWVADNTAPFFTPETSPALMTWAAEMLLATSLPIAIACNRTMTEADFRAELPRLAVPTLLIHGDKDASAPLEITGKRVAQLIPDCRFKLYEGAAHGSCTLTWRGCTPTFGSSSGFDATNVARMSEATSGRRLDYDRLLLPFAVRSHARRRSQHRQRCILTLERNKNIVSEAISSCGGGGRRGAASEDDWRCRISRRVNSALGSHKGLSICCGNARGVEQ